MIFGRRKKVIFLFVMGMLAVFACNFLTGADPTPTSLPSEITLPTLTSLPAVSPTSPPTETNDVVSPPEPTATQGEVEPGTGELTILVVNGYRDTFATLQIVGLVENNTDRALDDIEIEVQVYDAGDNLLYTETTFADLFSLAPGETSPFSLAVFEELPEAENFVATIVGNSVAELERAQVEIINHIMTLDDSGDIHVTGELINNNDFPVLLNGLAAVTFDNEDQILTADSYSVAVRHLAPGESGPFRVTMSGPETGVDPVDDFQIYMDAVVAGPVEERALTISNAFDYTDTFNNFHLVGQVGNEGETALNVSLLAAIYDAEGKVLDAASTDLPVSALAAGETQPFDFDFWGPLNYTTGLLDRSETYSIQVDAYWTWDTNSEYIDLSTSDDSAEFGGSDAIFTGMVVNNSGELVESATVVVFLSNKETGEIVATGFDFLFDQLANGASIPYELFIEIPPDFDPESVDVHRIVKGEKP